jgi:hypothetical protein
MTDKVTFCLRMYAVKGKSDSLRPEVHMDTSNAVNICRLQLSAENAF